MVQQFPKVILFAAYTLFALTACNKGVKQYPRDSFAQTQADIDKILAENEKKIDSATPESTPKPMGVDVADDEKVSKVKLTEDENRSRVAKNTKLPIIFGTGAGGITLKTTLAQSQKILAEPQAEDGEGTIQYREGLVIQWRRDKPRTALQIMIDSGYLGQFKQLSDYFKREIKVGTQFEEDFARDGGKGFELLKDIVRATMNKDKSFDCVAEGICSIEVRGLMVRMTFPMGLIAFSSDRKTLYGAALVPVLDMGRLDNPLDIILGQISDKAGVSVRIGESWGVSKEKIGAEQTANALSNSFFNDYSQVGVLVTRTQFNRTYVEPADSEVLKALIATRAYAHPIKFKNQFLKWQKSGDEIDMTFVDSAATPNIEGLIRLGQKGLTDRNTAFKFLEKLNEKILEKMQEESGSFSIGDEQKLSTTIYKPIGYPLDTTVISATTARNGSLVLVQRLANLQRAVGNGKIEGSTYIYDLNRKTGQSASFEFDMGKASFSRFSALKLVLPTDALVAATASEVISAKKHQLLGLDLKKSKVQILDLDLGRSEANVQLTLADGSTITDHANVVDPKGSLTITRGADTDQTLHVATVTISSFPDVKLYLSDLSNHPTLVAIETSQFMAGISELCNLKKFQPRRTQSSKSFMSDYEAALKEAMDHAKKAKRSFTCLMGVDNGIDGTGEIKSATFSRDQVKFNFINNELNSVIFY